VSPEAQGSDGSELAVDQPPARGEREIFHLPLLPAVQSATWRPLGDPPDLGWVRVKQSGPAWHCHMADGCRAAAPTEFAVGVLEVLRSSLLEI